ncbi:pyridoxamine 5'-phosphate oxidase [Streptomyces sp. TRM66268-LWL]|uniref:Pyridoxamine 5'-phosphate oxidase n=1 Tax=Streptomyces polyasparticus TaxID=2767826 RepID=A0ABR7SUG4_9ACTN|nr:pyridoxamine 5'-phosphate oxidase [Streptomyces polyasparticus]
MQHAERPPENLVQALAEYSTLTLAYVDSQAQPQACAVFFAVAESGALVFLTAVSTGHGAALEAQQPDAHVAFTAQADQQTWTSITGVQGRGVCRRVGEEGLADARAAYLRAFPYVAEDPRLAKAVASAAMWEITPQWLRVIDNAKGFGHKEEWAAPVAG